VQPALPLLVVRQETPKVQGGAGLWLRGLQNAVQGPLQLSCLPASRMQILSQIIQIFPNFNFSLLDNTRKLTNKGVYGEEQLEPSFELPPGLRLDMTAQFLRRENWPEKLKNWHSGVTDDGCWCVVCSTLFFSLEVFKEHILSNHNTSKIFRHNCENDNEPIPPMLQCDQCTRTFESRSDLTRHNESVHYQEHIECPSCDLTFSRRDNFQLHNINKHQKNPKMCVTYK
jgi:uncharacterized C2H2 Zn-finger protein